MKKYFVISVLMLLFCATTNAQVRFGLKGGANFTNFSWSEDVNIDNATGWQVGAMVQFKLPIIGLGVQPELLYSVSKAEDDQIGYFQVPVNLRWQIIPGPIKPVLLAGPYFGYAVNFSDEWKDNIKKTDWGVGIGGGVEVWKLQAMLRYSWGLQNISDIGDVDLKNNVFTVSLGFFFN